MNADDTTPDGIDVEAPFRAVFTERAAAIESVDPLEARLALRAEAFRDFAGVGVEERSGR